MVLKDSDIKLITDFVKKEPKTVQDISKLIKRSWVTTDSYLKQIKERTGLIDIKTFRKGSQAALKVVFYTHPDSIIEDDIKEDLYLKIKNSRNKEDFDFLDIFQYVKQSKKKAFSEEYSKDDFLSTNQKLASLLRSAENNVYCFSGNLSFINITEKNKKILSVIEELAKRKVRIKILTRVNIASISNIKKIERLITKYSSFIEIRYCYQPLRGFIIDDKIARFKKEEEISKYKEGELNKNTRVFYEIYDDEWISWLQKVFWNLFRISMDYKERLKEIKMIF